MAKTDWTMDDTVLPSDLNDIGQEINDNKASAESAKNTAENHASRHAEGGADPLTPAMIGAETPSSAQAKADTAEKNAKEYTDNHKNDTANPHNVTAAQVSLSSTNFTSNNVKGGMDELFINVDNGKNNIASAITDMGQSANGSETFGTLASIIRDISNDANAEVGNVLTGKTFYQGGAKKTGTMIKRGAPTITPGKTDQAILSGYYSGGTVQGDPDLIADNIREGKSIFGVNGTLKESLPFPIIYDVGTEYIPFVLGITNADNYGITRDSSEITLESDGGVGADVSMVIDNPVDVTNASYLVFEVESNHSASHAILSPNKNGTDDDYEVRISDFDNGLDDVTYIMDVSSSSGIKYIRFHLSEGSSGRRLSLFHLFMIGTP